MSLRQGFTDRGSFVFLFNKINHNLDLTMNIDFSSSQSVCRGPLQQLRQIKSCPKYSYQSKTTCDLSVKGHMTCPTRDQ